MPAPTDPRVPDSPEPAEVESGLQKSGLQLADFSPVSAETWRQRVEAELGEASFESLVGQRADGLDLEPLYTAEDLPESAASPGRLACACRIGLERHIIDLTPDELTADLAHGVEAVWLHGEAADPKRLESVLGAAQAQGSRLQDVTWILDGAGDPRLAAEALTSRVAPAGRGPAGNLGRDLLAAAVSESLSGAELDDAWRVINELASTASPGGLLRSVRISAQPARDAGGSAADELAWLLAGGAACLRRLVEAGFDVEEAAMQIDLVLPLDREVFAALTKLRAARRTWAKMTAACGVGVLGQRARIWARASAEPRHDDPWVGLLGAGVEAFAALVGGADGLFVEPCAAIVEGGGMSRAAARRAAVHAQQILRREAHLNRVGDPAAGSFYLENLGERLAREAWRRFQEIEGRGGAEAVALAGEIVPGESST